MDHWPVFDRASFGCWAHIILKGSEEDRRKLLEKHNLNMLFESCYLFLLKRKNEKEYFNVDVLSRSPEGKAYIQILIEDLQRIGWKCTLSFGNSALFIYRDTVPENCYSDESSLIDLS